MVFLVLGCRSTPQPTPAPTAVTLVVRSEDQAAKLSHQQNWPAAARAWQLAADRASLLNDSAGEAVALHNLGQAERALGQNSAARQHLEQAAAQNEKLGHTAEWWRNQIALLQVEADAEAGSTERLKARFNKLTPLSSQLRDHALLGLFLNELGLWQKKQGELSVSDQTFAKAEEDFKAAKDSFGVATVLVNRAQLFGEQKNYPAAISSWKTALQNFQALANPPGIARALAGQGQALLAAHEDLAGAEDLLRRALHNYRTLQNPKQAKATMEYLLQCLVAEGKNTEAEALRHDLQPTKQ